MSHERNPRYIKVQCSLNGEQSWNSSGLLQVGDVPPASVALRFRVQG